MRECLAVVFGCEKCGVYLEHKEFEIHCDNLALCWLLRKVKDIGLLGRWILRLAPFKFRVRHTRGVHNVVADALSRKFEGECSETLEGTCASLIHSLPLFIPRLRSTRRRTRFARISWSVSRKIRATLEVSSFAATCCVIAPKEIPMGGSDILEADVVALFSRRRVVWALRRPQDFVQDCQEFLVAPNEGRNF